MTAPSAALASPSRLTFTEAERRIFQPREDMRTSAWAARYRIVTDGDHAGRWTNELTPYLVEPMDVLDLPYVEEIYLCFAPQTGKSQVAFNFLSKRADQDPGPAMYVLPDMFLCSRLSNRRLIPTFRATPRTSALLSPRADDVTTYFIRFVSGMDVMLAWAGSPSALSSEPVRYMILDEIDKFPEYSGKEAAPLALARARLKSYPYTRKLIIASTPGLEGRPMSRLRAEADEVREFMVPCPICGRLQVMRFENVTYPAGASEASIRRGRLARYICSDVVDGKDMGCGMKWDDRIRTLAVRDPRARWAARVPFPGGRPRTIFYHLPAWYSTDDSVTKDVGGSLSAIAADYVATLDDPPARMAFVTQRKAESFREAAIQTKPEALESNIIALPPGVAPAGTVAVTTFVDPSPEIYWYTVLAWGKDMTCHVVRYGTLGTWAELDRLYHEDSYAVEGEEASEISTWRGAMDTGGGALTDDEAPADATMTERAYDYIRLHGARRVVGTKGMSHRSSSGRKVRISLIEKTPKGKPIPGGVELRMLDTGALKDSIHYRLSLPEGAPGRLTFHADTTAEFLRHIAAEEKERDKRSGRMVWVKKGRYNHWLDGLVGCFALADPEAKGGVRVLTRSAGGPGQARPTGRRVISQGVR